jgi:hypothetical protein
MDGDSMADLNVLARPVGGMHSLPGSLYVVLSCAKIKQVPY